MENIILAIVGFCAGWGAMDILFNIVKFLIKG